MRLPRRTHKDKVFFFCKLSGTQDFESSHRIQTSVVSEAAELTLSSVDTYRLALAHLGRGRTSAAHWGLGGEFHKGPFCPQGLPRILEASSSQTQQQSLGDAASPTAGTRSQGRGRELGDPISRLPQSAWAFPHILTPFSNRPTGSSQGNLQES